MKIELNEAKTHQQNQQNKLEKERLELKESNKKNSELQRETFDANKEIFDLKEGQLFKTPVFYSVFPVEKKFILQLK